MKNWFWKRKLPTLGGAKQDPEEALGESWARWVEELISKSSYNIAY